MKIWTKNILTRKGFTLTELLIAFTILSLLIASSFGLYKKLKTRSEMNEAKMAVTRLLEMARNKAVTGVGTGDHGVHITSNAIVAFEGPGYVEGDGDETSLPVSVLTDHSSTTIIFSRLTAQPSTSTDINLEHSTGATTSVSVSESGVIMPD
jgi:prepilin-type N-terminal cleavage/methylation domain-containing protein